MAAEIVTYGVDGRIGIVTINRPDKLNAISHELKHALVERLRAADADPGTSVAFARPRAGASAPAMTSRPIRPALPGAATRWPGTSRSPTTSGLRWPPGHGRSR
jgi:hypothetical protein